ncbi:MAG TPA: hypothetical protein VK633_10965, partial [Verrucomicrobiae bacterium]|nr:hypothetical protein [Verrucomicrobiae bacterium]
HWTKNLNDPVSQKSLVRCFFAYVEGSLFRFRLTVTTLHGMGVQKLSVDELAALEERPSVAVNARGEFVTGSPKWIPSKASIRLCVNLVERLTGAQVKFDDRSAEYNSFMRAFVIRDQLTHPKTVSDVTLNDEKLDDVVRAMDWFQEFEKWLAKAIHLDVVNRLLDETRLWKLNAKTPGAPTTHSGGEAK